MEVIRYKGKSYAVRYSKKDGLGAPCRFCSFNAARSCPGCGDKYLRDDAGNVTHYAYFVRAHVLAGRAEILTAAAARVRGILGKIRSLVVKPKP